MTSSERSAAGRRTVSLTTLLLLVLFAASCRATATPLLRLKAALLPERLGQDTTIKFALDISDPNGRTPPPVGAISLYYPAGLGIGTSGLGLQECTAAELERHGEAGCPSQSLMGFGTATAAVQLGTEQVRERAITAVYMAPFQNGRVALQFFLDAQWPLLAERIFTGLMLSAPPPYGGQLFIDVPLISSWSDGPDVALVSLRSTIGPLGITYYDHTHGKFVPYHPRGFLLPRHCPRRGFAFAASLTFLGGTKISRRIAVPCPRDQSR